MVNELSIINYKFEVGINILLKNNDRFVNNNFKYDINFTWNL